VSALSAQLTLVTLQIPLGSSVRTEAQSAGAAEHAVFCRTWEAERRDKETQPLFEALDDAS
jgi:hypothetical protein